MQFIIYCAFFLGLAFAGKIPCGRNEEFTLCGSSCPRTCQNSTIQRCPMVCVRGCSCEEGFVRESTDGPCVALEECEINLLTINNSSHTDVPKCEENEEFGLCNSACPSTCEDPSPKICPMKCVEGCGCKEGFIRSTKSGKCVAKESCAKIEEEVCKVNEIYKECGTACPATCSKPVKICPMSCYKGCHCKDGYVRHDGTKECVKIDACPKIISY